MNIVKKVKNGLYAATILAVAGVASGCQTVSPAINGLEGIVGASRNLATTSYDSVRNAVSQKKAPTSISPVFTKPYESKSSSKTLGSLEKVTEAPANAPAISPDEKLFGKTNPEEDARRAEALERVKKIRERMNERENRKENEYQKNIKVNQKNLRDNNNSLINYNNTTPYEYFGLIPGSKEANIFVSCVAGEAKRHHASYAAVGRTLQNRVNSDKWANNFTDVILQKNQFSTKEDHYDNSVWKMSTLNSGARDTERALVDEFLNNPSNMRYFKDGASGTHNFLFFGSGKKYEKKGEAVQFAKGGNYYRSTFN